MIFKDGLTIQEKRKREEMFWKRVFAREREWHRVFAFRPRVVGETADGHKLIGWLGFIERRIRYEVFWEWMNIFVNGVGISKGYEYRQIGGDD
jgi:hypothetical protein